MEQLLKQQAVEIRYLQGALDEEREARKLEFAAAARARTQNKMFQADALAEIQSQTGQMIQQTRDDFGAFKTELDVKVAKIVDAIQSTQRSTAATHAATVAVGQRLKQKILTGSEAEQLQRKTEKLQQQYHDLRKKKAQPIWKLF
jgi:hypothetical protein